MRHGLNLFVCFPADLMVNFETLTGINHFFQAIERKAILESELDEKETLVETVQR